MKDNLKIPDITQGGETNSIQALFCHLSVGQDITGTEYEKYCKGMLCHECMFSQDNHNEFIAWFGAERMKGNLKL